MTFKEWDNVTVFNWYYTDTDTVVKFYDWKLWLNRYDEVLNKEGIEKFDVKINYG